MYLPLSLNNEIKEHILIAWGFYAYKRERRKGKGNFATLLRISKGEKTSESRTTILTFNVSLSREKLRARAFAEINK